MLGSRRRPYKREYSWGWVKGTKLESSIYIFVSLAFCLTPLSPNNSWIQGVIMFLSFASFGAMPLLGYAIIPISFPDLGEDTLFRAACIITGLVLFLLGSVKSQFAWVWLPTLDVFIVGENFSHPIDFLPVPRIAIEMHTGFGVDSKHCFWEVPARWLHLQLVTMLMGFWETMLL